MDDAARLFGIAGVWCVTTYARRTKVKVIINNHPRNEMTCVVDKSANYPSGFDAWFRL